MGLQDYIDLNVDYMDMSTMYLYKIQNYNHAKKLGLPTIGIEVTLDNVTIGWYNPDTKEFIKHGN